MEVEDNNNFIEPHPWLRRNVISLVKGGHGKHSQLPLRNCSAER